MAKAITQIKKQVPDQATEQSQAVDSIIQELSENREAISQTIGILKELHDTKILEAVHSLLKQRTEVGAIAIEQINQPTMHNIMKNGMNTLKFLGSLQPGQLDILLEGVTHGMERLSTTKPTEEKQSLWQMRKKLWSPEVKAAMTTMAGFLEGLGEVFLRKRKESH